MNDVGLTEADRVVMADARATADRWAHYKLATNVRDLLAIIDRLASPSAQPEESDLLDRYSDATREALTCLNDGDVDRAVRHLLSVATASAEKAVGPIDTGEST